MAFNINQFRSQMTGDGARPNLFEVSLTFPEYAGTGASTPFTFMCKTAAIPASSIGSVEVQYFGRTLKYAGNRPSFPDLNVTIINAKVTQFAKNGRALKSYNFIGVFPTELSEIALDWSSNDAIEEYTVNLSYQWWEADDGSTDRTAITATGE